MKTNMKKLFALTLIIGFMASCQKDDEKTFDLTIYNDGYFVTNEGNYGVGNGSLSFIYDNGLVSNNVYENTNGVPLGDVVQSMQIIGQNAYIVVNNSNKVVVANKETMQHVDEISISQPRYISQLTDNKAYVTSWGNNSVEVIDLTTNTVTNSIPCGVGPESITVSDGLAYVTNVGGWGLDNTVTVIDITSDNVVTTINVGDKPNSAQVDANGDIWVLCSGYTVYGSEDPWPILSQTQGSLVKISNNVVVNSYEFPIGESPSDLVIDDSGQKLFYLSSGSVYSFDIGNILLSTNPLISHSFYGLEYHNGYLLGADAVDYVQTGYSRQYSIDGVLLNTFNVGIIPNGYCRN